MDMSKEQVRCAYMRHDFLRDIGVASPHVMKKGDTVNYEGADWRMLREDERTPQTIVFVLATDYDMVVSNMSLVAYNAYTEDPDFSRFTFTQMVSYMTRVMGFYDSVKAHSQADDMLCEIIRRLASDGVGSDQRAMALRIVEMFNDDNFTRWYS